VHPPPQVLVEALGTIDVGDGKDHDLQLQIDRCGGGSLGGRVIDGLCAAHWRPPCSRRALNHCSRTPVHWTIVSIDTKVWGETRRKPLSNLSHVSGIAYTER